MHRYVRTKTSSDFLVSSSFCPFLPLHTVLECGSKIIVKYQLEIEITFVSLRNIRTLCLIEDIFFFEIEEISFQLCIEDITIYHSIDEIKKKYIYTFIIIHWHLRFVSRKRKYYKCLSWQICVWNISRPVQIQNTDYFVAEFLQSDRSFFDDFRTWPSRFCFVTR